MRNALQLRSYGERHAAQQGAAPDATLCIRYAPALTTSGAGELYTLGIIERMSTILDFLSNNAFASALIAAAILGAIGWVWRSRRDRRDSDAIYTFLSDSKAATDFRFRSTETIASHTKLTVERVETLCARHPKIRRNQKEKESWTLVD